MSDKGRNEIQIVVTTTAESAKTEFEEVRAAGQRLASEEFRLHVTADDPITEEWKERVRESLRAASAGMKATVDLEVGNLDAFRGDVEAAVDLATEDVRAQIGVHVANPDEFLADTSALVTAASDKAVRFDVQVADPISFLAEVKTLAEDASHNKVDVPVEPDTTAFRAKLAAGTAGAGGGAVKIPVDVDTSKAVASTEQGMRAVTKLIIAGVVAGAAPAGGLLVAGLGIGFAGAAILAQKSNKDVVASYKAMAIDAGGEMRSVTAQVVPFITASTDALHNELRSLGPDLSEAFSFAGPDLKILTQGIDNFAERAMPGFTGAMRDSQPVVAGTASLLDSLGSTVGGIFGKIAQDSDNYGVAVQSLGPITSSAVGGAITLVNDLADAWSQNSGQIEHAVDNVMGAVDGFAHGALPQLAGQLETTLGAANGLVGRLAPMGPLLGTLAGDAVPFFLAWKGFSVVSGLVDRTGQKLETFGKQASGGLGQASTKVGQFAQASAAAFGAGAAGVVAGLEIYNITTGEVTRQESQLQSQTLSMTAAFQQSGGVINGQVNQALVALEQNVQDTTQGFSAFGIRVGGAAQSIATDMQTAGISVDTFNTAVEHGGAPLAELKAQLTDERWNGPTAAIRKAAAGLLEALPGIGDAFSTAKTDADQLADAAAGVGVSVGTMHAAQGAADIAALGVSAGIAASNGMQLAAAEEILGNKASTADAKVSALQLALKLMSEGGMEKANDEVSAFYQNLDTLATSLTTDKGKILDANGALDLTTARGRDVQTSVEAARDAMASYAEAAADGGQNTSVTTQKLQGLYDALEKRLLPSFGGNKKAVDALLTSMGLLPSTIETEYQSNAPDATAKANGVGGAVKKIPRSWFSTFSSNSPAFINQVGHASAAVRGVPTRWTTTLNAVDRVSGVVAGAQAAIDGLHGKSVGVSVFETGVASVSKAINSLFGGHASGGPVTSGWTAINEQGQEAVRLPNGSMVLPHANTVAMLGQQQQAAASSGPMTLAIGPGGDGQVGVLVRSLFRIGVIQLKTADGKQVVLV